MGDPPPRTLEWDRPCLSLAPQSGLQLSYPALATLPGLKGTVPPWSLITHSFRGDFVWGHCLALKLGVHLGLPPIACSSTAFSEAPHTLPPSTLPRGAASQGHPADVAWLHPGWGPPGGNSSVRTGQEHSALSAVWLPHLGGSMWPGRMGSPACWAHEAPGSGSHQRSRIILGWIFRVGVLSTSGQMVAESPLPCGLDATYWGCSYGGLQGWVMGVGVTARWGGALASHMANWSINQWHPRWFSEHRRE